ncbi:hypothetical protein ACFX15_037570 [Malus domestica]
MAEGVENVTLINLDEREEGSKDGVSVAREDKIVKEQGDLIDLNVMPKENAPLGNCESECGELAGQTLGMQGITFERQGMSSEISNVTKNLILSTWDKLLRLSRGR